MKVRRSLAISAAILCSVACKTKVPIAPATPKSTIVLLPDTDGNVGGITVTNRAGTVDLTNAYTAVAVERADQAPTAPFPLTQAEVGRIFGSALRGLPVTERSFLIYFDPLNDAFRGDSQAVLVSVTEEIKTRASTDVSVIGHADTSGNEATNYQIALRRATRIATALTALGVDAGILFVESHGDADLLIKTGRGVIEQRNRRVEIVVR